MTLPRSAADVLAGHVLFEIEAIDRMYLLSSTSPSCSMVRGSPRSSWGTGVTTASIYNWIYRGWITARHAPGTRNWIIAADDEQMRQLRERRARPLGSYTRARWAQPEQQPGNEHGTQP